MATRPADLLLGRLTRKAVAAPPVAVEGRSAAALLRTWAPAIAIILLMLVLPQRRAVVHPEPRHQDDDLRPLRGEHEHPLGLRGHPDVRPRRLLRLRRLRLRHPHRPRGHLQLLRQPRAGGRAHRAARSRTRHPRLPRLRGGGLRQPDLLPAGDAGVRRAAGPRRDLGAHPHRRVHRHVGHPLAGPRDTGHHRRLVVHLLLPRARRRRRVPHPGPQAGELALRLCAPRHPRQRAPHAGARLQHLAVQVHVVHHRRRVRRRRRRALRLLRRRHGARATWAWP